MDPNLQILIIQLASGVLGGNLAGKAMPQYTVGLIFNTILGIGGGGLGGTILESMGFGLVGQELAPAAVIGSIVAGSIGGGIVVTIVGMIKNLIAK